MNQFDAWTQLIGKMVWKCGEMLTENEEKIEEKIDM